MPSRGDSISSVLVRLEPGGHATFDSGHPSGSITVTRSKRPISVRAGGTHLGEFAVSGIVGYRTTLTADEAQIEVGRRRRIRDQAEERRANQ